MPRPRIQTDLNIQAPGLQPAARPTDTFVEQRVQGGSQTAQLARALSELAPSLARFGDVAFERKRDQDFQAGTEKAREVISQLDQNRKTYADAVREGKLPAHLNPWMKQGYYEELGRTYATRFQADITAAIETDENLKNSVEMGDFREFTSKFEKDWLDQNIPADQRNGAFNVGYGNRRDAIIQNLEAGWSAQTEERFTKRTLAMFRDEAVTFMQDALGAGRSHEDIGKVLKQMLDDKHALGWGARLPGQTVVDAIADVALEQRDSQLMEDLLKQLPRGPGELPAAYATEKLVETRNHIFTMRQQDRTDEDYTRTTTLRGILTTAATRFEEAQKSGTPPNKVDINDLQAEALRVGGVSEAQHLQVMADAYKNQEYQDDENLVARLMTKLHQGPYVLKQSELDSALQDKNLSLQTYSNLSNSLHSLHNEAEEKARLKSNFLFGDPNRNFGISLIQDAFVRSEDAPDFDLVKEWKQQAEWQFDRWYAETYRDNPNPPDQPGSTQRMDAIRAKIQQLKSVWYPENTTIEDSTRLMSGEDFDWNARPVIQEAKFKDTLQELALFMAGRASPSPYLVSLLNLYGIGANRQKQAEFYGAQLKWYHITHPPKVTPSGTGPRK